MKVILSDFVPHLGAPGDEVNVAPGYARNYLIPKKLGFEANDANRRTYENNLKQRARKLAKMLQEAEAQKAAVEKVESLTFHRKSGEEGKLFGSVTSADIEEALKEKGFDIDKKRIGLTQPIKHVGETEIFIKIHSKVTAGLKVIVLPEAPEEPAGDAEAPEVNETAAPEAATEDVAKAETAPEGEQETAS